MCVDVGISIPPSLLSAFSSSKHCRLHGKEQQQLSTQIQTQLEIKLY